MHVGHAYSLDQIPSCTPKSGSRDADSPYGSLRAATGHFDPRSMRLSLTLDDRVLALQGVQPPLAWHPFECALAAVGEPVPRSGDDVAQC